MVLGYGERCRLIIFEMFKTTFRASIMAYSFRKSLNKIGLNAFALAIGSQNDNITIDRNIFQTTFLGSRDSTGISVERSSSILVYVPNSFNA